MRKEREGSGETVAEAQSDSDDDSESQRLVEYVVLFGVGARTCYMMWQVRGG